MNCMGITQCRPAGRSMPNYLEAVAWMSTQLGMGTPWVAIHGFPGAGPACDAQVAIGHPMA